MNNEIVMHDSKPFELAKALRSYQQADSDGILVMVSRQACVDGADWLERLERECEIRYHEYTAANAHNDKVTKILLGIYNLLHPKDVHADDGQIFRFVAPNPNELLHELAKRIRAIPVELDNGGLKTGYNIGAKMFWIDAKDETVKPPTNRPILCYCPGWNNSGYQIAYYSKGRFDYDEAPNEGFHDHVEQWFIFLQVE